MSQTLFDLKESGSIVEIRKMILRVKGLPSCSLGQPISLGETLRGMIVGFDKNFAEVLAFGDVSTLKSGDRVMARSEAFKIPVGDAFIGRVVDGVAQACDGKEAIKSKDHWVVFSKAPAIMERATLSRPLYTGTFIVDSMIPIAKGQRELIVGDRMTGKTTLAVDAILNQKNKNVLCIYCCIGRSYEALLKTVKLFEERKAMPYTTIVSATADSPVGHQYLAPYTAATLGEYFMRQGRDVLVVFDDITKHAWIYRQISLLMDRSPGREAYPGDIFYIHSQLMERAAQLSQERGGGSMTFLPISETQQGDLTGYISSNLISMTDGQIYLNSDLFKEGFKPSLDAGLSVSRIGSKIQCPAMRNLAASLRLEYLKFKEILNLSKLRSNMSKDAQAKLVRGIATQEILKQNKNEPLDLGYELILLYVLKAGALDHLPLVLLQNFKSKFCKFISEKHQSLLEQVSSGEVFSDSLKEALGMLILEYLDITRGKVAR